MALVDKLSPCTMCIELSANGTAWTDFSDWLTVVDGPASTRINAQDYTFGEDVALFNVGKLEPVEIRLRGIYTDATATTQPFALLYTAHTGTCGSLMAVRWAPAGCATTNQVFSTLTTDARIIELIYPGGEAASAEAIKFEAVIKTAQITRATYA